MKAFKIIALILAMIQLLFIIGLTYVNVTTPRYHGSYPAYGAPAYLLFLIFTVVPIAYIHSCFTDKSLWNKKKTSASDKQ